MPILKYVYSINWYFWLSNVFLQFGKCVFFCRMRKWGFFLEFLSSPWVDDILNSLEAKINFIDLNFNANFVSTNGNFHDIVINLGSTTIEKKINRMRNYLSMTVYYFSVKIQHWYTFLSKIDKHNILISEVHNCLMKGSIEMLQNVPYF